MLLAFSDLSYPVGDGNIINVSSTVNAGETLVVRGPSGAGKSTLLRILSRLQPCTTGEIMLQGRPWQDIPATLWRTKVHYLSQRPVLFPGTVETNLAKPFETLVMKNNNKFNISYAKELMAQLLLPVEMLTQQANTLSGGEAARMAFVRALLVNPPILLLDEPTAPLDDKAKEAFYQVLYKWLQSGERAAVLVSHNHDYDRLKKIKYLDIVKKY